MQKDIHPKQGLVVFRDSSCDKYFLINSCCTSSQTYKWEDGNEYPLVTVDVSSASHPMYTGQQRHRSAEGRSAKFGKKFGNFGSVVKKS